MCPRTIEETAAKFWAAQADAAIKGGATPPSGGWAQVPDDHKQYYRGIVMAMARARSRSL